MQNKHSSKLLNGFFYFETNKSFGEQTEVSSECIEELLSEENGKQHVRRNVSKATNFISAMKVSLL